MNPKPSRRFLTALLVILPMLAGGFIANAQSTNAINGKDYAAFRVIAERNIFNPDRTARNGRNSRKSKKVAPAMPSFFLAGTMNYGKGVFAFFDGNNPDYRKILERNGVVAGYTVKQITLTGVELEAAGKKIQMNVGAQMRQNDAGAWEMVSSGEAPASSLGTGATAAPAVSPETSTETAAPGTDSSSEGNDVLKKLMQKREQELQ